MPAVVTNINLWQIAKYPLFFALLLYIVFAVVIVRQVKIMTDTLDVGFETELKLVAWGHLLFAVGTFIIAILVL